MPDYRITAALQHAMQYPSAHLDRFANFGPAFEMDESPARQPSRQLETPQPAESTAIATGAAFDAKTFITAGHAIFTLEGLQARYTYKVTRKDPDPGSKYQNPAYFVALLTGPDNLHDYTYVGMLDVQTGAIRLTRASKYQPDSQPVKAITWALARIWRGLAITPAKLYHIGQCGRCGRALTVPSSIEMGIGPECASRLG